MIPTGGALPNSISSFNRAADQLVRSFTQQEESVGLDRGVGGVETPAGSGTQLNNRDEINAPERRAVEVDEADTADPVQSVAELLTSEQEVRANLAVTRVQDRTLGSLLDIFA